MSNVLILSSHVAASRVGGTAQSLALAAFGIEPILVPTVLFGRHPGWGHPGGGAVEPAIFRGMLKGIGDQGLFGGLDAVITGYFSHPDQVHAAAETIDAVRAASGDGRRLVVVDPILGDEGRGLYVKPDVAEAILSALVPRADLITPNLWELGHIVGREVVTLDDAIAAAKSLHRPVVATSAPAGPDHMGVLEVRDGAVWRFSHAKMLEAPNGTGDLFTALVTAALLDDLAAPNAVLRAVSGVAQALDAAIAFGVHDLPVARLGASLRAPTAPVQVEVL